MFHAPCFDDVAILGISKPPKPVVLVSDEVDSASVIPSQFSLPEDALAYFDIHFL